MDILINVGINLIVALISFAAGWVWKKIKDAPYLLGGSQISSTVERGHDKVNDHLAF